MKTKMKKIAKQKKESEKPASQKKYAKRKNR